MLNEVMAQSDGQLGQLRTFGARRPIVARPTVRHYVMLSVVGGSATVRGRVLAEGWTTQQQIDAAFQWSSTDRGPGDGTIAMSELDLSTQQLSFQPGTQAPFGPPSFLMVFYTPSNAAELIRILSPVPCPSGTYFNQALRSCVPRLRSATSGVPDSTGEGLDDGQLGKTMRSGYGYGPPPIPPDFHRAVLGQVLAAQVHVRVQAGQHAYEGTTTLGALNQALGQLGVTSPVDASRTTPQAPVVLTVGEQQAPQVAAMLGLPGVGQFRATLFRPPVTLTATVTFVNYTVTRSGQVIARGAVTSSNCYSAERFLNDITAAQGLLPLLSGCCISGPASFATPNVPQQPQCSVEVSNLTAAQVGQLLQILGLPRLGPLARIGPATRFAPTLRGAPDQSGALSVHVRVQAGQQAYAEGATTRGALNQALQMLGWTAPVNAANTTPGAPVVLTVGEQQAPQVAATLGLPGVGQFRAPLFPFRYTPAPCGPGQQLVSNRCVFCDRITMPDGDTKYFNPTSLQRGDYCPPGAFRSDCRCVCRTGTFWNTQLRSCTPSLRAAPGRWTNEPMAPRGVYGTPDGDVGQFRAPLFPFRYAPAAPTSCPTGTMIWPDGTTRRPTMVANRWLVPECPPGATLSLVANQCRCSCPAGTFWNSRLQSCTPSLRGAPVLSGAPTGQLGNPAGASVSLSIGIGGLLLFGLAAYGIWRLARG